MVVISVRGVQSQLNVLEAARMTYNEFEEQKDSLISKINHIHQTQSQLESTLIDLDFEASEAIDQLNKLTTQYFGDNE